jgi:dTDP-4-amino-4,6-dideoxygalactose transaminase
LALHLALRAFDVQGEVITTPFSFAATVTSVLWEHCSPVFADVDPDTLNLDPRAARAAVTEHTAAILPTHVYGNPCDLDAFEQLRRDAGCVLIYDAAHAFGVEVAGRSIVGYGDASAMSFHATKIFHTGEGGAFVSRDAAACARVERMRNFGQSAPGVFSELGTNAKLSELHAALGLAMLEYLDSVLVARRRVAAIYDEILGGDCAGRRRPRWHPAASRNYAYYPLVLESEARVLATTRALEERGASPRRYFYPSLNLLPYVNGAACPVAEDAARRVICLPLHASIAEADARSIAHAVRDATG